MYSNVLWRSIASIVKTFLRKRRPVLAIVYMINQGWEVGRYRSAVTPFAGYAILWVSLYWHRAWLEFAWVIVGKRKRGRCRRWCRTWAFLLCHLRLPSRHLFGSESHMSSAPSVVKYLATAVWKDHLMIKIVSFKPLCRTIVSIYTTRNDPNWLGQMKGVWPDVFACLFFTSIRILMSCRYCCFQCAILIQQDSDYYN